MKRVIVVGGGFAGLNAAKILGRSREVEVTVVDRRNHHVFQPLLYQVAMAELSPADIAAPIRGVLSRYRRVHVRQGEAEGVNLDGHRLITSFGEIQYDYLILASGAQHGYFGHNEWEAIAPGLKSLEQATEIRRRVLSAYEAAECAVDPESRHQLLTFVIVGGGPTGVELAGAIAEMARFTLACDFRHIDPTLTRVILIHAGPRVLEGFSKKLSDYAARALGELGVEIWTAARVTSITGDGVYVGGREVRAATVLWAAGVQASNLGRFMGVSTDPQGRIIVNADLSIPGHAEVFVAGDMGHQLENPLPGVAGVAKQQGRFVAETILREIRGKPRGRFCYRDLGQMATIGHNKAVARLWRLEVTGYLAWWLWVFAHIFYLTGFRNRGVVGLQWAWTYFTSRRGARLILGAPWRFYSNENSPADKQDE